jgi:hypothetical protein
MARHAITRRALRDAGLCGSTPVASRESNVRRAGSLTVLVLTGLFPLAWTVRNRKAEPFQAGTRHDLKYGLGTKEAIRLLRYHEKGWVAQSVLVEDIASDFVHTTILIPDDLRFRDIQAIRALPAVKECIRRAIQGGWERYESVAKVWR